jgi:hypothetical protein
VEVFLERLLIELLAVAVQLAFMRMLAWLRERSQTSSTGADFAVAA